MFLLSVRYYLSVLVVACFYLLSVSLALAAPTPGSFSTTWKTDNPGTSSSTAITIPTTGGGYNYNIYWESVASTTINGSSASNTGNVTINFPAAGTYRVDITGTFPRLFINNSGDRQKLLTIEQWGSIAWGSMNKAFNGATNLTYNATDTPNLGSVADMTSMFDGATLFNGNINNWNVSNVTNMSNLFANTNNFNQPLNNWNVSRVTTMFYMFNNSVFNQNINDWNVASTTNMVGMFDSNSNFNQPLDDWDVSNVQFMNSMFLVATAFNQPLNSWDVSKVRNFQGMFRGATAFNQPLDDWDVSNATDLSNMFFNATAFNQPLSSWDVRKVTTMAALFYNASTFNQPVGMWSVASATSLSNMFVGATAFSAQNYTDTLIGWGAQGNLRQNVPLDASVGYFNSASTARGVLTSVYNWSITDGGNLGEALPVVTPPVSSGSKRSSGGGGGGRSKAKTLSTTTISTKALSQEQKTLLARIAELQALIAKLRAGKSSPVGACAFTDNLSLGSKGEEVLCLQQFLVKTGDFFRNEPPSGYFGIVTRSAVISWQIRQGIIPATGTFGPLSRAKYEEALRQ